MTNSKLLLALPLSLSLSLPLLGCATEEPNTGEPVTSAEQAAATGAVEGVVVAMAPISSGGPAAVAAAYRASFGLGGLGCATIATDDLTYVTVTFTCTGPIATNGTISLELASPTSLEATVDLTIGGVSIEGALTLRAPATPSGQGSLDGELVIAGTRRTLTADAHAAWTVNGSCVTYSSEGNITAEGPNGRAEASFEVDARTVCRP